MGPQIQFLINVAADDRFLAHPGGISWRISAEVPAALLWIKIEVVSRVVDYLLIIYRYVPADTFQIKHIAKRNDRGIF